MTLESCLPAALQGSSTTLTRIAAGLSGAGVYRVDAAGTLYVLKVSSADEPVAEWRERAGVQQLATEAGLAPRVVHVDEARRAVVSAFVPDRSFASLFGNPATRAAAIAKLGRTIRRVHELPIPPGARARDQQKFLESIWSGPTAGLAKPAFVGEAVQRALAEVPPASGRAPVLSHNDANPTNLVYDGENLLFLDWDTAAPNDPLYDLATVALFLRLDEASCLNLLAAYDGAEPPPRLPARFDADRRLVGVLCGAAFLHLALQGGHPGATGEETLETTPSLADFYQRMRAGAVNVGTADGQWMFGLALVKAGVGG